MVNENRPELNHIQRFQRMLQALDGLLMLLNNELNDDSEFARKIFDLTESLATEFHHELNAESERIIEAKPFYVTKKSSKTPPSL